MKVIVSLTVLLALLSITALATEYPVSPGTQGNTITLDVSNSSGELLQKLSLSVNQKPAWVTLTSASLDSIQLNNSAACQVHMTFSVERSVKMGEKGDVIIVLLAEGKVIARKSISLIVPAPETFELLQNYPNPFNPTTTIEYKLPRESRVNLKVYDVLGREVATLVNGIEKTDYYKITFDASRLASGVYFYRLRANDFVQTRKLSLLK